MHLLRSRLWQLLAKQQTGSAKTAAACPALDLQTHRPRYLDEALARQFTTAVRVGKKSKEAGKSIKEVSLNLSCLSSEGAPPSPAAPC